METITEEKVSQAQGAEIPELPLAQIRKMLETDLKTARALTHIVANDEDTANAVMTHLQRHVKNFPLDTQGVQKDARIASSILEVILGSHLMLDQLAEVIAGLQMNAIEKRKHGNQPQL